MKSGSGIGALLSAASAARLSEVGDKLHIEFSDVEALDVLAVEVDHVAVGYPALSRRHEHFEFASPFKGIRADKSVVFTVEIFDESVRQIKRKASRCRFSLDRSDRLAQNARRVGEDFVALLAFLVCQVEYRVEKVGIGVTELRRRGVVCVRERFFEFCCALCG